jgi:hypothetical protein
MATSVTCPDCGTVLQLSAVFDEDFIKCPICGTCDAGCLAANVSPPFGWSQAGTAWCYPGVAART